MKNLIRNGGFERGSIDFWTAFDAANFYVQNGYTHEGAFAGRVDCDGTHEPYIMPNDFIRLVSGEVAYFEAWLYASGMYQAELDVEYYDEGLVKVDEIKYASFNPGTSNFAQVLWAISGVDGAMYARPKLKLKHTTLNHFMVVDSVMMYKFSPEDVMGGERLMIDMDSGNVVGNFFGDWLLSAPFKEAEFKLYVAECSGTNPTIDVTIESWSAFDGFEHDIAVFEQVASTNNMQVIVLNEGVGSKIRAKGVVAGNPSDIKYSVSGIFKR